MSLVVSFCFVFFFAYSFGHIHYRFCLSCLGVLAQPNLKENCKVSLTQRGVLVQGAEGLERQE